MTHLLEVENLSKRVGAFVLDRISFRVEPGQAFGVLGSHGAGKSLLMTALSGQRSIDGGTVTVGGNDLHRQERQARTLFGNVPQQPDVNVPDHPYTPRELLTFEADLPGTSAQVSNGSYRGGPGTDGSRPTGRLERRLFFCGHEKASLHRACAPAFAAPAVPRFAHRRRGDGRARTAACVAYPRWLAGTGSDDGHSELQSAGGEEAVRTFCGLGRGNDTREIPRRVLKPRRVCCARVM